ncbi:MAG: hypothetical protein HOV96_01615 [Nonomuraea sp.]|nr:hypothetical protein [Nonomuraea sp.]
MRRISAALAGALALAVPAAVLPPAAQALPATAQGAPPTPSTPAPSGPQNAPPDVRTAPPAVAVTAGEAPAAVPVIAPSAVAEPVAVASARLRVELDPAFPRVLRYTDLGTGARLGGSIGPVTAVVLNGKAYPVTGTLAGNDGKAARFTLKFADLMGVELDASVGVEDRVTTFAITAVRDTEAFRVGTIDIPGHDLVSVGDGGSTAFTRLDPNSTRTADVFARVTPQTAAEAAPAGATYAIVDTGRLAAAIESNSTYDRPSGATDKDAARFWHQAGRDADGTVRVGVWSGQWTYRAAGAPFTAWVGVDDSQGTRGSVRFEVRADGRQAAQSPVLRNADAAHELKADVTRLSCR